LGCQAIEDSSRRLRRLFYFVNLFRTQWALNKPSHDPVANIYDSPFAATTFTLYYLLTHLVSPKPETEKKGK
jgi:hypothetical protein